MLTHISSQLSTITLSLKLVGERELVAQSARAVLWRGEVTGSSTPGYAVLMITYTCEIS